MYNVPYLSYDTSLEVISIMQVYPNMHECVYNMCVQYTVCVLIIKLITKRQLLKMG